MDARFIAWSYTRFRLWYVRLLSRSIYQLANARAEFITRKRWAGYVPLPRSAFENNFIEDLRGESISVPLSPGGAIPAVRHTKDGATREGRIVILRPTEIAALTRALGHAVLDCDFPALENPPVTPLLRYCCECEIKKPLSQFDPDKSHHDGLAYACKDCREEIRDQKHFKRKGAA